MALREITAKLDMVGRLVGNALRIKTFTVSHLWQPALNFTNFESLDYITVYTKCVFNILEYLPLQNKLLVTVWYQYSYNLAGLHDTRKKKCWICVLKSGFRVNFHCRVNFTCVWTWIQLTFRLSIKIRDDVWTAYVKVKSWALSDFIRLRKLSFHRIYARKAS